ncbi:hypothetical protein [Allocoleopsis franciscana]|uniref:Uncharacterized protein n=1 Tax=Allocoleopsis franciscana PCC 7113 TaxID=1173027 RepID=K9WG45_9CYAN|nr:hypothetical protein [Allocoleopsis franciscana]AFZ19163.1 hypothetical protein Mic7113_3434 [Allocoleopsis franciscana PCC 7113]
MHPPLKSISFFTTTLLLSLTPSLFPSSVGARHIHWCQLNVSWAVETAAIQTKPAYAGFKTLVFPLVHAGGLRFYSREFHSPGLKLTPMVPLLSVSAQTPTTQNRQTEVDKLFQEGVQQYRQGYYPKALATYQ